ncbi:MAG TPA: prepilin-type N-terminal cleavage/methylation domain-containing protein [Acidimicrobiales bacterium]|nr:prepilin-type N-terminal cleavage/methylation domain-containing protein [Acidimicrobiales bacterium]
MSAPSMLHPARKPLLQRSVSEIEVSGFNLIELLVVLGVLGVLAAIITFALAGTAGAGSIASCGSDSRTINQAAQALVIENPGALPTTPQAWKLALLGRTQPGVWTTVESGAPFLQSWPSSSSFTFSIAGAGAAATTGDVPSINPANGDVIVAAFSAGIGTRTFDSTAIPLAGCATR